MINTISSKNKIIVKPGFIFIPRKPSCLFSVVGSGIVLTMYDVRKKYGGMNHYTHPIRKLSKSTPIYGCPAIIGLLDMFLKSGSRIEDLESHVYGGSHNAGIREHTEGIGEENIRVAIELLERKNVHIAGKDVGGRKGRKIIFDTSTGEIIVAKINNIRSKDWYPKVLNA